MMAQVSAISSLGSVTSSKVTCSPLSELPTEVLAHILGLVHTSFECDGSLLKYRFPSIASRVSRHFRHLTLSTPLLWSYLHMTPQQPNIAHNNDRIHLRSGVLPLDVYASLDRPNDTISIVETLESCSARWRKLCLKTNEPNHPFLSQPLHGVWLSSKRLLQRHLPHLSSLVIENATSYPTYTYPLSLPLINAPLQTLWLEGCSFLFLDALPSALQTLYVHNHSPLDILPLRLVESLQGSPSISLRSLSLNHRFLNLGATNADADIQLQQSVTLERLEFFELGGINPQTAAAYFRIIKTPVLQHLSLRFFKNGDHFSHLLNDWRALFFPTLRELTMAAVPLPDRTLVGFLLNLPVSMTRLNIVQDLEEPIGNVLHVLKVPRTTGFCQRMEHFSASGLHLEEVAGLVEKRLVSLKELALDIRDCAHNEDDDPYLQEVDKQLETIRGMVPTVRVIWMRDYYNSVLRDEPDPYLQGSQELKQRKSTLG